MRAAKIPTIAVAFVCVVLSAVAWSNKSRVVEWYNKAKPSPAASPTDPAPAPELDGSRYVRELKNRKRVIVFVHGIGGDTVRTWTNMNLSTLPHPYWPDLVEQDPTFDDASIFVVGYPTARLADLLADPSASIGEAAQRVRAYMHGLRVDDHQEFIFVCHSMGGLVVRKYLQTNQAIGQKTKMIMTLSTPNSANKYAAILHALTGNRQAGMMADEEWLQSLRHDWLEAPFARTIATHCAYERLATRGVALIVEAKDATWDCNRPVDPLKKDHESIAKPANLTDSPHFEFKTAYLDSFPIVVAAAPEALRFRGETVVPARLPPRMLEPIVDPVSPSAFAEQARQRGSIELDGGAFVVAPAGANATVTLTVDSLTLKNGARIVTNGNTLKLQANRIVGAAGAIVAFTEDQRAAPAASPGSPGEHGNAGGTVVLDTANAVEGPLMIDLSGQHGGAGGQGRPGPPGREGARGANAADAFLNCASSGSNGAPGGQGGSGEDGQPGGRGGDGGRVLLLRRGGESSASEVSLTSEGGRGGSPGPGGDGGPGGPGGQGGSGSTFCGGGHGGPSGPAGPSGRPGAPGPDGQSGAVEVVRTSR